MNPTGELLEDKTSTLNPVRGIVLKVLSVVTFLTMFSLIKGTAAHIPAGEAVFFRSSFALPPIVAWLMWRGVFPAALKVVDAFGHVWRGAMGTAAMGLGFAAVGLLPLPEVVAIGYTAPLLVTVLAAMFLGERIRLIRLGALILGLFGVGLVLLPRLTLMDSETTTQLETIGALSALMAAVFSALAQVFARRLVATETTGAIVFWFSMMSMIVSLVTVPLGWVWPSSIELQLLIGAGLLGGIGQILLTESYRHAEVAVIAPFDYTSMLFAIMIGYLVFDEVPTTLMLTGAALIITAGIIILERERRLGLSRRRARAAVPNQG